MDGNWSDLVFVSLPQGYLCSAILAPWGSPKNGWQLLKALDALILLAVVVLPFLTESDSGLFAHQAMQLTVLGVVSFIGLILTRSSGELRDTCPENGLKRSFRSGFAQNTWTVR